MIHNSTKRLTDLLPGQPERVDVIGCPVVWISDVINSYIIRMLLQKFLDTITQMSDYHDQPLKPLGTQNVDQPFEDRDTSDLRETLGGIKS